MKKFLNILDSIIRLPLHLINRACFHFCALSVYTQDRIALVTLGLLLSTFFYWAPIVFGDAILRFSELYRYLEEAVPAESSGGFVYHYQSLIAGLLALMGGVFAVSSPLISSSFEKFKTRREFVLRMRAFAITLNVEINSILDSVAPLEHYNLQTLMEQNTSFLSGEFYWALSDDEAYLADSIQKKIDGGKKWLEKLEMNPDDSLESKKIKLEGALQSFCSSLIDAETFMVATLNGHFQIVEFYENPDIDLVIERNLGPVRTAMRNSGYSIY